MERSAIYELIQGHGLTDYERYLDIAKLLQCQKPFEQLCHEDELQFQIVHQVQELWMKLLAYTLLDVDDSLKNRCSFKVLTLFQRIHLLQENMLSGLATLETMSPKDYQVIRERLGQGSGQESPGFSVLVHISPKLWSSFETHYLSARQLDVAKIYSTNYRHDEAYVIAEAMLEYDERFQRFRYRHLQLVHRIIGLKVNSLKGRSIDHLIEGINHQFYPELWSIRSKMTSEWAK